jgi:pullulanase
MRNWIFKNSDFESYPNYDGSDLGVRYTDSKVLVCIWAPTCKRAFFRLYKDGVGGLAEHELEMTGDKDGVWRLEVEGNWDAWFYTIQIRDGQGWLKEGPDIYARATGVNGHRGMIFNPLDTDPDGWKYDKPRTCSSPVDMVIYETHIRDFSISPDSGIKNKGKYIGFTELETRSPQGELTGVSHIKELGITHVHFLPVADFFTVDEAKKEAQYNWGYDPLNYNTPEGWYSSDPYDGRVRIKELKEMIKTLHDNSIGVILDVVYNHTGLIYESYFNQTVPGYFYRQRKDGTFSDASGCGTEIASEREMVRKYIIDSICYWAKEFHVDGFRFDLMGVHDIDTMNQIREAVNAINPGIFIYGEGWAASESPLPEELRAVKANASKLNGIAVFSDDIRDSLKGSTFDKYSTGFISGHTSGEELLKFAICGAVKHEQVNHDYIKSSIGPWAKSPEQCVNYVSCHDNYTLFDKLQYSCPEADTETIERMGRLAAGIIITSQGVPFLHAGTEMLRSKGGHHDSYRSPDLLNKIEWKRKSKFKSFFEYTCKCIKLRSEHPAFRINTEEELSQKLKFFGKYIPGTVCYELGEYANNDSWRRILVLLNGNNYSVQVDIPDDEWIVVAHDGEIDLEDTVSIKTSHISLHRISMMILVAS